MGSAVLTDRRTEDCSDLGKFHRASTRETSCGPRNPSHESFDSKRKRSSTSLGWLLGVEAVPATRAVGPFNVRERAESVHYLRALSQTRDSCPASTRTLFKPAWTGRSEVSVLAHMLNPSSRGVVREKARLPHPYYMGSDGWVRLQVKSIFCATLDRLHTMMVFTVFLPYGDTAP